jgi:signal transduction histidine kinase
MGLRHRSIRLRVGILIVVPVVCLIALYAFAAVLTGGSALTQTRAKTIKDDLATPVTAFQAALDAERHDALLSLAAPTNTQFATNLALQEQKTGDAKNALTAAMHAPAVTQYASAAEHDAIEAMLSQINNGLPAIRQKVSDEALSLSDALNDYGAIINAGFVVIDQALAEQANVSLVTQAKAVIDLDQAGQAIDAEADLLNADVAQLKFPESDRITFAQLAFLRQTITSTTLPQLTPQYRALMTKNVTPADNQALDSAEAAVIDTSWRKGPPPSQLVAVAPAFQAYGTGMATALAESAVDLQQQAEHQATTVIVELILAAGLGLIGTIASIVLSLIIGRGLVRQLRELRESALSLANEKLPGVITRLRAGQSVEVSENLPEPVPTSNEIEQVQHAFNIVQQTAIQSAVDEARLRRGISEVFRNLAGRSQSLLHRQLTLLDGMERRATEPDELEDLFRIDHLTTRMRRHAEGLIILSGEAPARGWRQPVPLVDVLRAAVAEVEDYTRIRVLSRTSAAVSGHAVADVIHLIAELAENATVFSPPNTPVRIQGDIVGRGFAIEIEDRGLGISPARLEEINANLDRPPQFDLSGSDRLGLFIAGQLAQRHDIKITLRPSVYGGTTAIVLIPTGLVVEEDTFERDPALPAGSVLPDDSTANRFAARTAELSHAAGRPGNGHGGGRLLSLEPDPGRMSLTTGSPVPADPPTLVVAGAVTDEPQARVSSAELAELGLPVRVRQASMAPQLRTAAETAAASDAGSAPASVPAAGPGSPEEARNTVSALQRGWQLGRAEGEQASAAGLAAPPEAGPARSADALPGRSADALPGRSADALLSRPAEPLPSRSADGPSSRSGVVPPSRSAEPLPRRSGDAAGRRMDSALSGQPDDSLPGIDSVLAGRSQDAPPARTDGGGFTWSLGGPAAKADDALSGGQDSGSFGLPEAGSYSRPAGGPYGRHDSGRFSRPDTSSPGWPESSSPGWPENSVPSRLITDRLPADPLAADRLAAERLAAERLAAEPPADRNAAAGNDARDED